MLRFPTKPSDGGSNAKPIPNGVKRHDHVGRASKSLTLHTSEIMIRYIVVSYAINIGYYEIGDTVAAKTTEKSRFREHNIVDAR